MVLISGRWIESRIIAALLRTGHQLEWISDVVASAAITTLSYLWLHLRAARAKLSDLERSRIAVDEQFRLAGEIQRSLLPVIPHETRGYRWAVRMEQVYEVGGDFYDFVVRTDDSVILIIGDVSGKGLPAALLHSTLTTLFRVHASTTKELRIVAERMSEDLVSQTGGVPYATAILALLTVSPPRITYVNAGHPPGVFFHGKVANLLETGGIPLGLLANARYASESINLEIGDFGFFMTDGITEQFMNTKIMDKIMEMKEQLAIDPTQCCEQLFRAAEEASKVPDSNVHRDDRTVLAFSVR